MSHTTTFTQGRSFLLQGTRPTQEDTLLLWEGYLPPPTSTFLSVYAVFDGHNGRKTADLCRLHFLPLLLSHPSFRTSAPDIPAALRRCIARLDARVLSAARDGATLLAAVFCRGLLHIANVGDSRAVLARRLPPRFRALTNDHNLSSAAERARVAAAGGVVRRDRLVGLSTELQVTRALGDREFKERRGCALIAEPELLVHHVAGDDAMLLVATDGLWDLPFFDADDVVAMALGSGADVRQGAEGIVREAIRFGSRDNVALLLVRLNVSRGDVEGGVAERKGEVSTEGRPSLPPGFKSVYWEGSRMGGRAGNGRNNVLRSVSGFLASRGRSKGKL